MYRRIQEHPGVRALYARRLVREGSAVAGRGRGARGPAGRFLRGGARGRARKPPGAAGVGAAAGPRARGARPSPGEAATGIARETLARIGRVMTTVPSGFNLNPKMVQQLARKAKMAEGSHAARLGDRRGPRVRLARSSRELPSGCRARTRRAARSRSATSCSTTRRPARRGHPWRRSSRRRRRFGVFDSPLSEFGRPRLRVRLQRRSARGARPLGGAVRRLRQRRAGHHRPVRRLGRGQVAADDAAGPPPSARLRGPGPRALERADRAVPSALRRRQHAGLQRDDSRTVLPPAPPPDARPQTPGRSSSSRRRACCACRSSFSPLRGADAGRISAFPGRSGRRRPAGRSSACSSAAARSTTT